MYDWPEVQAETDALWADLSTALRASGFDAPLVLTRPDDPWALWTDPNLLVAQTCGYPLVTRLKNSVTVLATPHYDVAGCDGPYYSSAVVVRSEEWGSAPADFLGRIAAINAQDSLSGMAALRRLFAPVARNGRAFGTVVTTGSHRESVRAVAEARADIAAIDAVAWQLAQTFDCAWSDRLRVLAWTPPWPGLPLITRVGRSESEIAALRAVLVDRLSSPETEALRRPLAIAGASAMTFDDYAPIVRDCADDETAGYPAVA